MKFILNYCRLLKGIFGILLGDELCNYMLAISLVPFFFQMTGNFPIGSCSIGPVKSLFDYTVLIKKIVEAVMKIKKHIMIRIHGHIFMEIFIIRLLCMLMHYSIKVCPKNIVLNEIY